MDDTRQELLSDYLTKTQLAEELHRHPRTLDRWARLRAMPPETVIGRQRLYRRSSVVAWLEDLEKEAVEK